MNISVRAVSVLAVILIVLGGAYYYFATEGESTETISQQANTAPLSDEQIMDQIDELLAALMTFHYISVDENDIDNPDVVILSMLTEAMNDLNKLKDLQYKSQNPSQSSNQIIATTGLVIKASASAMIPVYESWIAYLRGVDINTLVVSDFQYEFAKFNSSNHDIYLKLVEGASYLPMVTVVFGKNGDENTINEDVKTHFLAKIDELFSDILIDDDKFHEETGNRYAVAVLVRGYKDFYSR